MKKKRKGQPEFGTPRSTEQIGNELKRLSKLLQYGWHKEKQSDRERVFGGMTALQWALNGASGDWTVSGHFAFKRNKRPLKVKLVYAKGKGKRKAAKVTVPKVPTVLRLT